MDSLTNIFLAIIAVFMVYALACSVATVFCRDSIKQLVKEHFDSHDKYQNKERWSNMEKEIFGKLTFDTETANEKLKAVIEAHEKFMQALYEYEHAVDYNNVKIQIKS